MRIDGLTFVLSCWQLGWQNILNLCEYNGYDIIKVVYESCKASNIMVGTRPTRKEFQH